MGIDHRRPGPWTAVHFCGVLPAECPNARSYLLGGFAVVEFHGDVDLVAAPEIRMHVDSATSSVGCRVVVDLRPVRFMDCAALTLLCRARRRAVERGGSFRMVCTRAWHLHLLKAAGLTADFQPVATVTDALAGGRQRPPA
ncbi:STAS domain-containing protein [Streptomyces sp. NPDC026206]|uniref:STAS domain-containing protein n=1 Tax=Streptomyces sp. NPDC026206 TaxID=3157089 RepID=UPI0033DCE27D